MQLLNTVPQLVDLPLQPPEIARSGWGVPQLGHLDLELPDLRLELLDPLDKGRHIVPRRGRTRGHRELDRASVHGRWGAVVGATRQDQHRDQNHPHGQRRYTR